VKIGIVMPIKGGIIKAVTSLAEVNRALICASLSDAETFIECGETPDEINETVKSLKAQGAKIRYNGSGFEVAPIEIPKQGRGFAAAAAAHGFAGQNSKGNYRLQGDTAYRSINGLFFTLPIQIADSLITVEGKQEYLPSIEMTIDIMKLFGIRVEREVRSDGGAVYKIAGGQNYKSPGIVKTEGDWTNSAFWLCAAAICGDGIICSNLKRSSRQGDREVISVLERFGAITAFKGDSVAVRRSRLRSIRIDAAVSPDIVPILAVVAAVAEGQSVIYNAERVGLNKNGVLKNVCTTLTALGADIIENSDGLVIQGKPNLRGGTITPFDDSSLTMMSAIAACVCEDTVAINGAEAVDKKYPDFFDDFEKLGGIVTKK